MLAAGGSVDKFWSMYAQHQKKEVGDLLEKYRIGSLVSNSPSLVHNHIALTHMLRKVSLRMLLCEPSRHHPIGEINLFSREEFTFV